MVEQLLEHDIIQNISEMSEFDSLNYENESVESYSYHISTSKVNWTNYSDKESIKLNDLNEMDSYVSEENIPPNYKKILNSAPKYYLEDVCFLNFIESENIMGKSKINKKCIVNFDDINLIINNCFKSYDDINMYATGKHLRKHVPSGGARHPIEAYLLIVNVDGLDKGLYHYNVKFHRLDLITINDVEFENLVKSVNIIPRGRSKNLAASFIHTCIFKRSMFRYREPRSYRVMNFDLGHIHANEVITSNILNLNYCEAYSVPESVIESIINLDGIEESVMSAFNLYGE